MELAFSSWGGNKGLSLRSRVPCGVLVQSSLGYCCKDEFCTCVCGVTCRFHVWLNVFRNPEIVQFQWFKPRPEQTPLSATLRYGAGPGEGRLRPETPAWMSLQEVFAVPSKAHTCTAWVLHISQVLTNSRWCFSLGLLKLPCYEKDEIFDWLVCIAVGGNFLKFWTNVIFSGGHLGLDVQFLWKEGRTMKGSQVWVVHVPSSPT